MPCQGTSFTASPQLVEEVGMKDGRAIRGKTERSHEHHKGWSSEAAFFFFRFGDAHSF